MFIFGLRLSRFSIPLAKPEHILSVKLADCPVYRYIRLFARVISAGARIGIIQDLQIAPMLRGQERDLQSVEVVSCIIVPMVGHLHHNGTYGGTNFAVSPIVCRVPLGFVSAYLGRILYAIRSRTLQSRSLHATP